MDLSLLLSQLMEEKNHAALVRSGKEFLKSGMDFPDELFHNNLENLEYMSSKLSSMIKDFKKKPPSREEAFNYALKIENSACEVHFQKFMDEESDIKIGEIFRKLNEEDKDHENRIRAYMIDNDIKFKPPEK